MKAIKTTIKKHGRATNTNLSTLSTFPKTFCWLLTQNHASCPPRDQLQHKILHFQFCYAHWQEISRIINTTNQRLKEFIMLLLTSIICITNKFFGVSH